jgi:alpha-galactosidase
MRRPFASCCVVGLLCSAKLLAAQTIAPLQTADTTIQLQAGSNAPQLLTIDSPLRPSWRNDSPEPLIKSVEIDDRETPVNWQFNQGASRIEAHRVAFVYESEAPHLRLTWEWQSRAAFGPIEHQIHIENLSDRELWLPLQDSIQFNWSLKPDVGLEQLYIEKGANTPSEAGTHVVAVPAGYKWQGTSSTYAHPKADEPREIIPWFLLEESGGSKDGWYIGIEFSGRTQLTLERSRESLKGSAGLNAEPGPFRTRLEPGESFDTPVVFVGASKGGSDATGNVLRRWVRAVLGNPLTWNDPRYPLLVNNSWGGGMNVNDAIARGMIRDASELGLEMFHMDAGWFRGVGDWYPNPKKFPNGLAVIADEAHQHGMKFGLWVDWTQAAFDTEPGALNARDPKVRDWMVTDLPPDWKPEDFKGQTIDLGVPAAKEWAQREVERIVDDYHLDMLEHDGYLVAQGCDRTDHPHAPPNNWNKCIYKAWGSYWVESSNSTDVSYHAVRAYYDIYSKLKKNHPGLLLEVCDDGGRMVDFGSAAHADYFSITDTYDPISNRRAFYDASHVLPSAMLENYVEKWPVPRPENFLYMLRSGMMGWLTVMIDTTSWTSEQHALAKDEFQLYKKQLRPLIRDADLYHISSRPDGVHWDAIEYFDPKTSHGGVYIFRGSTTSESTHYFVLKGLTATAAYQLHFHDHSSHDRSVTGRELLTTGLKVTLLNPQSSELVFLRKESRELQRRKKLKPF